MIDNIRFKDDTFRQQKIPPGVRPASFFVSESQTRYVCMDRHMDTISLNFF